MRGRLEPGCGPVGRLAAIGWLAAVGWCLAAPAGAEQTVTVQLKWKHQFQFAGHYVALERGYYREAGLDVRLVEADHHRDPVQEVLSGRAQYGVGTTELVVERARGRPVVVLAVICQHSPLALAVKRDGGITNTHQLARRKVMIEPGSAELLAYLRREGLDSALLTLVPHNFSTADLLAGRVAAMSVYVTDEPFEMRTEGLPISLWSAREAGIDFYGDNLFTTAEQVRCYPRQVAAFREATLRGWRQALAEPDAAIDLILARYSQRCSRAKLRFEAREMARLIMADVVDVGYMNPGRWRHIAETYREAGLITAVPDLDQLLYEPVRHHRLPRWAVWALSGAAAVTALLAIAAAGSVAAGRRLRASQQSLRDLLDCAPTPFVITDAGTDRICYLNRQAAAVLRVDQAAAVGRLMTDYYAAAADRAPVIARLRERGALVDVEVRFRRHDGEVFWSLISARLHAYDGRPAILAGFMDLTEQKALQADLQRALDEVRTLQGIFPICMHCKKVRNDQGLWEQIDAYFHERSLAEFSHGICPDCLDRYYSDDAAE